MGRTNNPDKIVKIANTIKIQVGGTSWGRDIMIQFMH